MRVIALEGASRGVHCNAIAPFAATGMTGDYLDADMAARMAPERVAPVASWLMSPDCALNGETLTAGAGRVRRAARVEGRGLEFLSGYGPADLAGHAEQLLSLEDWTTFDEGQAGFDHLMAADLPKVSPS